VRALHFPPLAAPRGARLPPSLTAELRPRVAGYVQLRPHQPQPPGARVRRGRLLCAPPCLSPFSPSPPRAARVCLPPPPLTAELRPRVPLRRFIPTPSSPASASRCSSPSGDTSMCAPCLSPFPPLAAPRGARDGRVAPPRRRFGSTPSSPASASRCSRPSEDTSMCAPLSLSISPPSPPRVARVCLPPPPLTAELRPRVPLRRFGPTPPSPA